MVVPKEPIPPWAVFLVGFTLAAGTLKRATVMSLFSALTNINNRRMEKAIKRAQKPVGTCSLVVSAPTYSAIVLAATQV